MKKLKSWRVSRLEARERRPHLDTAARLTRALDVRVDDLLDNGDAR
jgi:hypothetical protein